MHTHYHNLRVSSSATSEEIGLAYITLTKQENPDKHPANEKGHRQRNIRIIRNSHKVLSDPKRRQKYDQWLAKKNIGKVDGAATQDSRFEEAVNPPPSMNVIIGIGVLSVVIAIAGKMIGPPSSNSSSHSTHHTKKSHQLSEDELEYQKGANEAFAQGPKNLGPGIKIKHAEAIGYTINVDLAISADSSHYNHDRLERKLKDDIRNNFGEEWDDICEEHAPLVWNYTLTFSDGHKDKIKIKATELCEEV